MNKIKGVVSASEQDLIDLADRLMLAINSSTLVITATSYGSPIKHESQELYALVLRNEPKYNGIINKTLTPQEKQARTILGSEWFTSSEAPFVEEGNNGNNGNGNGKNKDK